MARRHTQEPSRPSKGSKVLHVCAGAYSRDLASTMSQLESGIGPALVCASLPFGVLKYLALPFFVIHTIDIFSNEPRAGVRFYALLVHVTYPAAGVM